MACSVAAYNVWKKQQQKLLCSTWITSSLRCFNRYENHSQLLYINEYYSPDWAIQTIKKAKKWAHRVYMYTQSGAKRLPKERNKIFFIVSSLIFVVVLFSERSNTHIWLNGWCLFSSALSYLFDRHLKPMSHKNPVWFQINFWFFFEYLRIFNWMQYFYMESCYAYYVS